MGGKAFLDLHTRHVGGKFAERIRARAILRAGELLEQIQPSKGGRSSETKAATGPSSSRKQALLATQAYPNRQRKTARRVTSLPKDERRFGPETTAATLFALG